MYSNDDYYTDLACAYIAGHAIRTSGKALEENVISDTEGLMDIAAKNGLKIYYFKRKHADLARVKRVMGLLRSLQFEILLDVGSGRGVFLLPFLDEYPDKKATCVDVLAHRVELYQDMISGGVTNLSVRQADITNNPFDDDSFDIVTMLEVLEHIPDVQSAVTAAVRMAKKYVIVSVPSHKDDNPEHIHLLTKSRLQELFACAGCTRLKFFGVNGHLIMLAILGKDNG